MKSGEGTLIAFATGPGQTALDGQEGTNSPFTRALLANITTPGIEIQQAMTKVRAQVNEETNKGQLPWGHTNLIGSVYLNGAPPARRRRGGCSARPRSPLQPGSDVELEFWRSIKESNKPEELNAYLTNYPNGQFKSLALSRIAALETGQTHDATRNLTTGIDPATFKEESNQTTEDQIGLDKGQRRDVQRRLNGLGFDTKVTGEFDEQPVGDHALAGRARLSQERLPQQAAAQGAADRNRRDRADRELQRGRPKRRRRAAAALAAISSGSRRRRSGSTPTPVPIPPAPGASSAA